MTSCQDLRGQPWRETTNHHYLSLSHGQTTEPATGHPETDLGDIHQGSQFDTVVVVA